MKYNPGIETSLEKGWLNLHRNENMFVDDSVIKEIVIDAVNCTTIQKYPDPYATDLRIKLAALHNISPDNIFIGNGADEVLSVLFYRFRKLFKQVNLPRVCFKMYDILAAKYDYMVNHFSNFPDLEQDSITSLSGFIIIDSPGSITGQKVDKKLFSILTSNEDNIVILDNVHGDFCADNTIVLKDNLVTIRHFSHYYGLAALRIGYCVAPTQIVAELNRFREPFSVNSIAQAAAIGCLKKKEYFDAVGKDIMFYKTIFENHLRELKFEITNSSANYVLVKHPNVKSIIIHQKLLDEKIATRYYSDDPVLQDYLRIAIPPKVYMGRVVTLLNEIINHVV